MTFKESDLRFQFSDADWQIKKYDTHRYFKILSGAGLKGIDFLGIYRREQVVFFEVKNYHTNHASKQPNYLVLADTPAFVEQVANKMEDTLRAINVIRQYLLRQWWYRFFLKYERFIPTIFVEQKDWYFWHRVEALINTQQAALFVLWLEIATDNFLESRDKLLISVEKALKNELEEDDIKVVLANKKKRVFTTSLLVN